MTCYFIVIGTMEIYKFNRITNSMKFLINIQLYVRLNIILEFLESVCFIFCLIGSHWAKTYRVVLQTSDLSNSSCVNPVFKEHLIHFFNAILYLNSI